MKIDGGVGMICIDENQLTYGTLKMIGQDLKMECDVDELVYELNKEYDKHMEEAWIEGNTFILKPLQ